MHIEVRGLNKQFGDFHAVQDVSFDIAKGQLIGLLGPSGGGKTSILRMLAGLESPSSGDIVFHGKRVNDLPPQERGIGFVFQNYALVQAYDRLRQYSFRPEGEEAVEGRHPRPCHGRWSS